MTVRTPARGRAVRPVALIVVAMFILAACQPGWTAPFAGSGDGTGVAPGATDPDNASVSLQAPTSVVAIPGGGFYVYDAARGALYRVANDVTSLYAGTPGDCGDSGDGGTASAARIDAEIDAGAASGSTMALDGNGNLYLPGDAGGTLRRIDAGTRIITSIALPTDSGNPRVLTGLTADTDGSIVLLAENVMSPRQFTIYRVAADGSVAAVSDIGTGRLHEYVGLVTVGPGQFIIGRHQVLSTYSVNRFDVGHGTWTTTGAQVENPIQGLSVGANNGSFYAADATGHPNRVVRVDPDNKIAIVAGTGAPDPGAARQTGSGTDLDLTPTGVAVTPNHGLLISSGHVVYRLDHPGQAGEARLITGFVEPMVDAPLPTSGPLAAAAGTGSDVTLYMVDVEGCRITMIDAGVASTFAGTGTCGDTGDGGPATDADIAFGFPSPPGVDADGNVYFVQDIGQQEGHVRKISPDGVITSVPGATPPAGSGLVGMAVFADGTITMNTSDLLSNSLIRRLPDGTKETIMTFGNTVRGQLAAADPNHYVTQDIAFPIYLYRLDVTAGTFAAIGQTQTVGPGNGGPGPVVSENGTIYALDSMGYVIRIDPDNVQTRIAGNGMPMEAEPLHGHARNLPIHAKGLALGPDGDLYVASDHYVYRIANPESIRS